MIKKIALVTCLIFSVSLLAQYSVPPSAAQQPGWIYYDGDEFNGTHINEEYWGIYGSDQIGNSTYNQKTKAMLQTYRPEQVTIQQLISGETVCRIRSEKDKSAPSPLEASVKNKTGWWSGGLSSRDAVSKKYYPLFSRIEIKAKAPYVYGVWNAFWLRHYKGASVAELDILEFFVKAFGDDDFPAKISQAIHMYNNQTKRTEINLPKGQKRYTEIGDDSPGDNFHIYAVQIDPDPMDKNHAIITFFVDDKVNYQIETRTRLGDAFNDFITTARNENRLDRVWDIALTGQIGGFDNLDIGYPAHDVNLIDVDIDWVRVYVRDPNTAVSNN